MNKLVLPQNEEDILAIPIEKRVFMFWQSSAATPMPGYLSLCLETLVRFNPDISILLINYDNLPLLVGSEIDLKRFVRLTLPVQSDILFVYFIYKWGGAFIDVDIIYTNKFDLFSNADPETLYMLGQHGHMAHLAFFLAHKPKSFLLWHILQMQMFKLSLIPQDRTVGLPWNFMGNSIVDPLVQELAISPNALNFSLLPDDTMFLEERDKFDISKRVSAYRHFYFLQHASQSVEEMLTIPQYGIIYLHNSWTPRHFLQMSASEFIKQDIVLARIFRHLLGTDTVNEADLIQIPIAASTL